MPSPTIYSTPNDFWIQNGAIRFELNALSDPDKVAVSLAAGAVIMAWKQGVIDYNAALNYRTWVLSAASTHFDRHDKVYVYVRLSKVADTAQLVFPYEKIPLDPALYYDESDESDAPDYDLNYYYILLGALTPSEIDGVATTRYWSSEVGEEFSTGILDTDEYRRDQSSEMLSRMFVLNEITNTIETQKDLTFIVGKRLLLLRMRVLGSENDNAQITAIATSESIPDSGEFTPNDASLITTAALARYAECVLGNKFFRKDQDDVDPYVATFGDVHVATGLERGEETSGGNLSVDNDALVGGDATVEGSTTLQGKTLVKGYSRIEKDLTFGSEGGNDDFVQNEKGCKIYWDGSGWCVEADYMNIHKRLYAKTIQVDEVTHVGGEEILTEASCIADGVIPYSSNGSVIFYRVLFRKKNGEGKTVYNKFRRGDLAYCQVFNVQAGATSDFQNKYYWRLVIGTSLSQNPELSNDDFSSDEYHYIDLSNINGQYDNGGAMRTTGNVSAGSTPAAEDPIVQLGYIPQPGDDPTLVSERQGATIVSGGGRYKRAIIMFEGISSFSIPSPRVKLSPSDVKIVANSFDIRTSYGQTYKIPIERGNWSDIPQEAGQQDNYHRCYYYDVVQHNGATWLCVYQPANSSSPEYTTDEPSESSTDWMIYAQKGQNGESPWFADLDNEMDSVACKSDGKPTSAQAVTTTLALYHGISPESFTVSVKRNGTSIPLSTTTSGVTVRFVSSTKVLTIVYAPTAVISDKDEFEITLTNSTYSISRVLTLTVNGVRNDAIYAIQPSMSSIPFAWDAANSQYTPASRDVGMAITKLDNGVTSSFSTVTNTGTVDGDMVYVRYSLSSMPTSKTDGTAWPSGTDSTVSISNSGVSNLYIAIFNDDGKLLDRETIPVMKDGVKGEKGDDGLSSPSVVIPNPLIVIPADKDGKAKSAFDQTYRCKLKIGDTESAITAFDATGAPTGVTVTTTAVTYSSLVVAVDVRIQIPKDNTTFPSTLTVSLAGALSDGVSRSATGNIVLSAQRDGAQGEKGDDAVEIICSPANILLTQSTTKNANDEYPIIYTGAESVVTLNEGGVPKTNFTITGVAGTRCTASLKSGTTNTIQVTALSTDSQGNYYDNAVVTFNVNYGGQTFAMQITVYANLLGTWKERVEQDTKTAVAQTKYYLYDKDGNITSVQKNIGEFIQSSSTNEAKLTDTVTDGNGTHIKSSEIKQTVESISFKVEETDNKEWLLNPYFVNDETMATPSTTSGIVYTNTQVSESVNGVVSPYADKGGRLIQMNITTAPSGLAIVVVTDFSTRVELIPGTYHFRVWVKHDDVFTTTSQLLANCRLASASTGGSTSVVLSLYANSSMLKDKFGDWEMYEGSFSVTESGYRWFEYRFRVGVGSGKKGVLLFGGVSLTTNDLKATGVDIENRKITLTTDNLVCQNNDGDKTMWLDANGNLGTSGNIFTGMTVIDSSEKMNQFFTLDTDHENVYVHNSSQMSFGPYPSVIPDIFKLSDLTIIEDDYYELSENHYMVFPFALPEEVDTSGNTPMIDTDMLLTKTTYKTGVAHFLNADELHMLIGKEFSIFFNNGSYYYHMILPKLTEDIDGSIIGYDYSNSFSFRDNGGVCVKYEEKRFVFKKNGTDYVVDAVVPVLKYHYKYSMKYRYIGWPTDESE